MKKKGMSQALTIVVAAVVLIVVSLIIITITTGVLGKFGGEQAKQTVDVSNKQASATVLAYCKAECIVGNPSAETGLRIQDETGLTTTHTVVCDTVKIVDTVEIYTPPPECVP